MVVFDDLGPASAVGLDQVGKLRRRAGFGHFCAELGQAGDDLGILHGLVEGGIDLGGQLGLQASGCIHAKPGHRRVAGQARFGHRGQLGRKLGALGAGDGQRTQAAAGHMGHAGGDGIKQHMHLAGGQIADGLGRALVGHMGQGDAGLGCKGRRVQVHDGAIAAGGVVQLAGVGLGIADQLLHGLDRQRVGDQQHAGGIGHMGNGCEVLVRAVGQLGHQVRRDRMGAAGGEQQGVAIGARLGGLGRADGAARARAVVNHQRLAQLLRHLLRHHAGDQIGGTAGRKRHDDADRAIRPWCALRSGKLGQHGQGHTSGQAGEQRSAGRQARKKRSVSWHGGERVA